MPQTGQKDKKQPLYLVTALVQIVTRKQPATIIQPQPPSGGPACRARRREAMAIPPSSLPQWQGPTPAGSPSTGQGCLAHGLVAIWREREKKQAERESGYIACAATCTAGLGHTALALVHKREGFLSHTVYENLLEARVPSEFGPNSGIIYFRVICPAVTSSHMIPFSPTNVTVHTGKSHTLLVPLTPAHYLHGLPLSC